MARDPRVLQRKPKRVTELEQYAAQHRGAGEAPRARLLPRRLRGGAGEPHDRDRGLRPAGAHAALVLRRALHPPARAPEHGPLRALRGRVPRRSRAARILMDGNIARREHAGDGARARPRRLLQEQPAVRALPRAGRRQHRRAGRSARAPHPAGDRRGRHGAASRRCSMPRSRSSRTSTSTATCTARATRSTCRRRPPRPRARSSAASATCRAPPRRPAVEPGRRARAGAAAPGVRSALVHRPLRARARAVGARHLPRGARRVVLLLPGVRLPDHERGLGLVLARAPAARGRLPAAAAVPRRDQGALGRGAALRRRTADRARDQSLPPRLHAVGAHHRRARPRGARAK